MCSFKASNTWIQIVASEDGGFASLVFSAYTYIGISLLRGREVFMMDELSNYFGMTNTLRRQNISAVEKSLHKEQEEEDGDVWRDDRKEYWKQ